MRSKSSLWIPAMTVYIALMVVPVLIMLVYIGADGGAGGEIGLLPLAFVAVAGFGLGYVLFRQYGLRLARRFQAMIAGMNDMLEGNRMSLERRTETARGDELDQLGLAFNELSDYLAARQTAAERELELSYRLQRRLLPPGAQRIGDCAIAAACSQTKEVGGDLYDIVPFKEGGFAVIVGDVAGKGMQAALLMSGIMALFRREIRFGGSAGEVLTRLNELAYRALRGRSFVSMGLAIYRPDEGDVQYASAGHMPPYIIHDGALEEIIVSSLPLGAREDVVYRDMNVSLPRGGRFILITDGLVESPHADGGILGFERFEQLLLRHASLRDPGRQVSAVMEETGARGGPEAGDDRTILIVARD